MRADGLSGLQSVRAGLLPSPRAGLIPRSSKVYSIDHRVNGATLVRDEHGDDGHGQDG